MTFYIPTHLFKAIWPAFFAEILLVFLYFAIARHSISLLLEGNISESFVHVSDSLWIINIGLMVSSIVYFCYRPIRNTSTILLGIMNLNWLGLNLFLMYP